MDYANWGGEGSDPPWKQYEDKKKKDQDDERRKKWESDAKAPSVKKPDHAEGFFKIGTVDGKELWVESHQGKHSTSKWPGYTGGQSGPFFLGKFCRYNSAPIFLTLTATAAFKNRKTASGHCVPSGNDKGIIYFNCGGTVVGFEGNPGKADKQTPLKGCQLQWSETADCIYVHGCPDPKGKTFGTPVDVSALDT